MRRRGQMQVGRLEVDFAVPADLRQHNDVHASVLTAALGRCVGCNRMIFGITRGRKPLGEETGVVR